jgi:threonylcarbamoyladenosine tRNA methylthiotransferase MtaB
LHRDFVEQMVGKQAEVLFESTMRGGMMYGYTGNYVRVKAPYRRDLINKISRVKLCTMDENDDIFAEIIE